MSLKRKSRSLGQLAGLGASSFGASKTNSNHKSGLLRTTSRNPDEHEDTTPNHHKKISRTTPKRLKGLVRPRPSSTTPLGKAVFGRSTPKSSNDVIHRDNLHDLMALNQSQIIPNRNRTFLMDTQVMYTVGLQCQERSIFLFSDMIIIAKERSTSNFKLKDQVPLSDLWLSTCISDVSEVTLDQTRSFVIGWPITNAVITLNSSSQKELWWEKLTTLIKQERRANPSSTNIQLGYFEQSTNFEHVKNICVRREDSATDCIVAAVKVLDLNDLRTGDLQLWVRTKTNESPYPLIGHELPLVIKMHWMKKTFEGQNQKSFEDYKLGTRCSFILRKTGPASTNLPTPSPKYNLKKVTSSIRLQNVFRRVSQGSSSSKQSEAEQIVKNHKKEIPNGKLFGHSLEKIPTGKDGIPKAIEMMLLQLLEDGPATVGIFRRSPNARAMRELRNKLDEGEEVDFKECSVFVTAALIKDFLRSLPDSLLPSETFGTWTEMTKDSNNSEKVAAAKRLLSKLAPQSHSLLRHVIYILKEIDSRSQDNMMTSSNLAICVGPCVLWSSDAQVVTGAAYASDVSRTTKLLIDEFKTIFGPEVPPIFASTLTTSLTANPATTLRQNNREKLSTEYPATRTPPLTKPPDSIKPFALQRSYTTLDKSMLDSVLYSDEPKKVSLPSLIDDDVLDDLYDDADRISSQDACDSVDTENESDILARRAMHLFPIKNNVDLFWGETPIRHRHNNHHREDDFVRAENGFYKNPHKRRTANQKKRQAPLPPDGRSPKSNSKVVRSNSVNQVRGVDEFVFKPMQWHRSKSTTRLNIATSGGGGSSGGGSNSTDDEIQMTILPNEEYGQILVDNYFVETGAGLPQASPNPPDYDETISRQRFLRYHRRPEGSTPTISASPRLYHEATSPLNAHQMASLSINENNNGFRSKSDLTAPPPLPPKERPPLPPKQRYTQRSSVGSIHDNTYANMTQFYPRFDDDDDLYAVYADPPHLPPKEPKSPSSASSSLSTAATQTLSMCDAETQTNEDDFYYNDDDDLSFRDDLSFDQSGCVDVVLPSDDRMSAHLFPVLSPRESPRSSTQAVALPKWSGSPRQYQQHLPQQHQPPHRLYHTPSHHQLLQQQQQQQQQQQLYQQHPQVVVGKDNSFQVDKIGWSVSQLRSLFNQDRSESVDTNGSAYSDQQHSRDFRDTQLPHAAQPAHRFHPQVGKDQSQSVYNNSHFSDENSDEESYV